MDTIILNLPDEANLKLPDPSLVRAYEQLENRTIWIDDEIDSDYLSIVDYILKWNKEDSEVSVDKRKPIKLLFSSPGGDLDIEEVISAIIEISQTPIIGIAMGMVASAASLIFLSCHKRYALKSAYWVFHKGGVSNISGDYDNIKNMMKDYDEQVEKMEQFYISHTDFTEEEVKKNMGADWYIHEKEALKRGMIHKVLGKEDLHLFW